MRSFAFLFAVSAFVIAPPSARADAPAAPGPAQPPGPTSPAPSVVSVVAAVATAGGGEDEVILKNGGMIRGTVTELEPNKSVTILVQGSGASRTLPWSEVDRVARGIHGSTPGPAANVSRPSSDDAPSAGEPAPVGPGLARIHIASLDPQVQLHRYLGMATTGYTRVADGSSTAVTTVMSELVCRTPCDQVVDGRKGEEFYFAGKGIAPSPRFQLFDKQGDLTADVEPGSLGQRIGGVSSLVGGGAVTILGAATLGLGAADSFNGRAGNDGQTLMTVGAVALGVGVAAVVTGVVLLISSKTTYALHPPILVAPAPPPPPPPPPAEVAAVPAKEAVPAKAAVVPNETACREAKEYDRRAAAADTDVVREQLERIARHKHRDCVGAGQQP